MNVLLDTIRYLRYGDTSQLSLEEKFAKLLDAMEKAEEAVVREE